ncbi:MAG: alpha/beta hydrolase [Myxococcales bacterium]|nr:alpha/beta hydrolase [Myxococcales bacterium]
MATVTHEGASIYYEIHGSGPAICLAHGAGGNALSWWQQVPHFARSHSVVAFDHRSFGRSVCAPADFQPRFFADDLFAILDAAGIERAALVCQSMGGWTGLRAALEHPERVAALVLAGTPGGLFTPVIAENMAQLAERLGGGGVAATAALAPDFPEREPARAFLYGGIGSLNTGFDPAQGARLFDEAAWILPEALAEFRVPTLVLSGQHDLLFPPEIMNHVAELIPGASLERFPETGHSTYYEDPERFNEIVGQFLAKHWPGEG